MLPKAEIVVVNLILGAGQIDRTVSNADVLPYMNPKWPEKLASTDSVYAKARIANALEWIWTALTRPENDESWASFAEIDPLRTRIELFDMVWWVYFRRLQPVQPVSPI